MSDTQIAVEAILERIEALRKQTTNQSWTAAQAEELRSLGQQVASLVLENCRVPTMLGHNGYTVDPTLLEIKGDWNNKSYWIYPEIPEGLPPVECIRHFIKTAGDFLKHS